MSVHGKTAGAGVSAFRHPKSPMRGSPQTTLIEQHGKAVVCDDASRQDVARNLSALELEPPPFEAEKKTSLKPESIWIRGDLYGPPDPVSNLPHVSFLVRPQESPMERKLREMRKSAHDWNHRFWTDHNTRFSKEKAEFIGLQAGKVSAEDMAVFYKDFLNRNRSLHNAYNKELYARNIRLLWPEAVVTFRRLFRAVLRK